MFNPLLFQGLYYLAKARRDAEVPECCDGCEHYRGLYWRCDKDWLPENRRSGYCSDSSKE